MMFEWIRTSGLLIIAIIGVTWLASHFGLVIIRRVVGRALKRDRTAHPQDEKKREDTLVGIIYTTLKVAIWSIAVLAIISEFGVNMGPLIAGAGVIGLAIAFGAQELIRDFISGIFVVVENQYRVGDVIEINGVSGKVKAISMRTTVLRDLNGQVHHIPNGTIKHATNKTMGFSRVNMTIGVSYDTDIDKMEKVINELGQELARDEDWINDIIEPPRFTRISDFADSAIMVKVVGKTKPGAHWSVEGELRRRLKAAFEKAGIEIPYPQRVVHQSKPKKN